MTGEISFAPNREARDRDEADQVAAARKEKNRPGFVLAIDRTRGQIEAAKTLLAEAGLEAKGELVVALVQALAVNEANAVNRTD
jgi:hypothetical protein